MKPKTNETIKNNENLTQNKRSNLQKASGGFSILISGGLKLFLVQKLSTSSAFMDSLTGNAIIALTGGTFENV